MILDFRLGCCSARDKISVQSTAAGGTGLSVLLCLYLLFFLLIRYSYYYVVFAMLSFVLFYTLESIY